MPTMISARSRFGVQATARTSTPIKITIALALCIAFFPIRPAVAKQESSLRQSVQSLAHQYGDPQVDVGIWVSDLQNGEVLFSQNPDQALIPASNQKILLMLLALKELGPQYRFPTRWLGGPPESDGSLSRLVLAGGGDPTLRTIDLWKMAAALKSLGVTQIKELFLDDTLFPAGTYPGHMNNRQIDAAFNAPVGALALDQNLITLVVRPGFQKGAPAQVQLDPPLPGFPLENLAKTEGNKTRLLIRNRRQDPEDETLTIKGNISLGSAPQIYHLAQVHPRKMVERRVLQALQMAGVKTLKPALWAETPTQAPLSYQHLSRPLQQILSQVGKDSNNFVAEQILKTLAARKLGPPGTTEAGVGLMGSLVDQWALPHSGLQLENASGLSRNNRMTVKILAEALKRAYTDPFLREDFLSSLSVLGVDGTLKDKFFGKGLQGHFRGKTGTLSGVSSLSGFVIPKGDPQRGPYLLAFIANGAGKGFWRQLEFQQRLLELLIQSP